MVGQPESIGCYRIIDQLGRGGMGMVYRAEHRTTGEVFALKTVKVPNPAQIEGIRREIRALARINHPGVIRIVDEGIENDVPWYAMNFLQGVSLRQYSAEYVWGQTSVSTAFLQDKIIPSLWKKDNPGSIPSMVQDIFGVTLPDIPACQHPEDPGTPSTAVKTDIPTERTPAAGGQLEKILILCCQISKTLGFLHGHGLIHGDLKPDNIILRPDGFPVIIDFGLVTQMWSRESRETLEIDSIKGGTIVYIAPEVINGDMVDARADLYSLGCIMYELITGKSPITGDTLVELIRGKMEVEPVPPSKLASNIPDELDRLIMKMLAKRPRDRVAYAEDVVVTLLNMGLDKATISNLPDTREYLYRSRFTGRDKEITILENAFDDLDNGAGKLVLIGGESGIGKTRFLMRLLRESNLRKNFTLSGECVPAGSDISSGSNALHEPLSPLKRPLRSIADLCFSKGQAFTERIFGSRGKVLSEFESLLSKLPGQDNYPPASVLPANSARLRLYTVLCEMMTQLADYQKTALFLDDLQWADDLTLGFIEFSLRMGIFPKIPFLIIAAFRIEEQNQTLQRLSNDPNCRYVVLSKLDQPAVNTIITDMLALPKANKDFTEFLTRFSEGNPFFISEYLRAAVLESLIYRDSNGFWQIASESREKAKIKDFEDLPLPKALSELVNRRLNALSVEAREIIKTAAVLGREFPSVLLWNIVSVSDGLFDTIDELIKRQILYEPSPGTMRFVHDKIRETIYQSLSPEQRSELHGSAASSIETLFNSASEEHAPSLAYHWESAGDHFKAGYYHLRYARTMAKKYSLNEASKSYSAYFNLLDKISEESVKVRIEFIEKVLHVQSRHKEVLDQYSLAEKEARQLNMRHLSGRCLIGIAQMNKVMGDMKSALQHCAEAELIYNELNDSEGKASVSACYGDLYTNLGKLPEARTALEKALAIYRQMSKSDSIANTLSLLAPIHCMQGDHTKGNQLFEEALLLYKANNDRLAEGFTLSNIANIEMYLGRMEKAKLLYEQAISILKETGDLRNQGIILGNLGRIYLHYGEYGTAEELFHQSLDIHRQTQNPRMEGITLMKLADIYRYTGKIDDAEQLYHRSLKIFQDMDDLHQQAITWMAMAEFERIVRGNYNSAGQYLDEAEARFRDMKYLLGLGMCACQRGLIALMKQQSCEAQVDFLSDLMVTTQSGPETHLGQTLTILKKAQSILVSGGILFRGEDPERIPLGLKKWLVETGQL